MNRGKKGVVVDLKPEDGCSVVHDMIKSVDVIVVNFRPDVAKRLGIGCETAKSLRPDSI
jgi:crotonobetainyl-CoA:carnitine CoA-transferase CaiB-like acyl-CoA transferase